MLCQNGNSLENSAKSSDFPEVKLINKKYKHEITTIMSASDLLYIKINGIKHTNQLKIFFNLKLNLNFTVIISFL